MKKLYDICVVASTYEKGGETKKRYVNIGAVMEGDKGMFALLDPMANLAAVPREAGRDRVIASFFEPKDADKPIHGDEVYKPMTQHNQDKGNGYQPSGKNPLDELDQIPF